MTDDLDIAYGGAIAVDTEALRDVARRMDAVADRFAEAQAAISRAHRLIMQVPVFSAHVDTAALWSSAVRAGELHDECVQAVIGTTLMADVYEYVELQAQADALALTDTAAAGRLRLRLERLAASDERIPGMAQMLVAGWEGRRFDGLHSQFDLGGALAPFFLTAALAGSTLGLGRVLPGMRLTGTADAVAVTPVKTARPETAPAGLAETFRRLPSAAGAQIKIERYTMADGSRRFVTYLKGTQAFLPVRTAGSDPWDMKSNTELYSGRRSASYQATVDALAAAGARPGDWVDVVAHSQTGMVAAHLAMESEYDVRMQITAGSPVEPTLREDQTLIQLRHTDDLVSGLAGGGSPGGTGSPDSFTATREGDRMDGIQDVWADTHMMHSYIETAEMVDASADPRVAALGDYWSELDEAVEIVSTEYRAERTG